MTGLPPDFIRPAEIKWARALTRNMARVGGVLPTTMVRITVQTICSVGKVWTAEDRRLVEAAAIDALNEVRWAEVGR